MDVLLVDAETECLISHCFLSQRLEWQSMTKPKIQKKLFLFSAMALLYMFRVTISPIIRSTYAVYGHR